MKQYFVKGQSNRMEFIEILKEIEDGYLIRHTRQNDGYKKVKEETISRHLFNICLKTGYLFEPAAKNQANTGVLAMEAVVA